MKSYIVNKNAQIKTGEHKIHTKECKKRPKNKNIKELGEFASPKLARCEANKFFICVDGCMYCCKEIHLKS